jgi:hypothetical protein
VRIHAGSLLIASYSAVAFFAHLSLHGFIADAYRKLFLEFNSSYAGVTPQFAWAMNSKFTVSTGMQFGAMGGVFLFVSVLTLVNSGIEGTFPVESMKVRIAKLRAAEHRTKEPEYYRDAIAGSTVIVAYLATFMVISYLENPFLLSNLVDVLLVLAFGGISGISTSLFIYFRTMSRIRQRFTKDKKIQLKIFELEHSSLQQLTQLLMYGLFGLLVGLIASPIYQTYNLMPGPISGSPNYQIALTAYGLLMVTIVAGFFFGVWAPVFWQSQQIVEAVKEYGKKYDKL